MRDTGANIGEKSLGLEIASFRVFTASLDVCGRPTVPSLERVRIVLSHLLFGCETIREFVEDQIGIHGRDAADQNHEHPFHCC